jgi:hypothetical protein
MKHREQVNRIRDLRTAIKHERWSYSRANLLYWELFLISFLIIYGVIARLRPLFLPSVPFGVVAIAGLLISFYGGSFCSRTLIRLGLLAPIVKLLICLSTSSFWGLLAGYAIKEWFHYSSLYQWIVGLVVVLICFRIRYQGFEYYED